MKPQIDQIKIFGERHTATNALTQFINVNFDVSCRGFDFLGWKHRRAPLRSEWKKKRYLNTLFIFSVREPHAWLRAMGKQTWNPQQPEINNLSFTELLTYSFEDYESIIHMWNEKYTNYIRMANEVPYAIFIKKEDFSADQHAVYKELCLYLQPKSTFQPIGGYVNGGGLHEGRDHKTQGKEYPDFSDQDLSIVNAYLDKKLCAYFNYN
ncbi:MAG: hypothetical protein COB22_00020 [Cycloclasticus sp.]|nr:MAG: hypothetical protein COB22_00020 [Cycloclasticus sp.]